MSLFSFCGWIKIPSAFACRLDRHLGSLFSPVLSKLLFTNIGRTRPGDSVEIIKSKVLCGNNEIVIWSFSRSFWLNKLSKVLPKDFLSKIADKHCGTFYLQQTHLRSLSCLVTPTRVVVCELRFSVSHLTCMIRSWRDTMSISLTNFTETFPSEILSITTASSITWTSIKHLSSIPGHFVSQKKLLSPDFYLAEAQKEINPGANPVISHRATFWSNN